MKPTTKAPTPPPAAQLVPLSGGSWLLDEATGTLTRLAASPAVETPADIAVETAVETAFKEVR